MLGVALALILVGVIFLFTIPFVGIIVGPVGLVLLLLYLFGFGRRAATRSEP